MTKILVTGASGYIGQHLCLALAESGWHVRGLSRSPRPGHLDKIEWQSGDITDAQAVACAVTESRIIVHLACLPLVLSTHDPIEAMRVNVGGTVQVLEAARRADAERLVFASTGQVYGGQSPLPNAETDLPLPASPYAASKLAAEIWCQAYTHAYELPVQILRLFNIYGMAANGHPRPTVETAFLQQIRRGQRPQVRGNPQSGRDFIHIQDVVRAISLALTSPPWEGPLNIGTGVLTTLVDLAHLAARVLNQPIEPEIIETGEPCVRFQADTARAQARLGFRAEVELEAGLRQLAIHL